MKKLSKEDVQKITAAGLVARIEEFMTIESQDEYDDSEFLLDEILIRLKKLEPEKREPCTRCGRVNCPWQ